MTRPTSGCATNQRPSCSASEGGNSHPTQQPVSRVRQNTGERERPSEIRSLHYIRQFHKSQKARNQKFTQDPQVPHRIHRQKHGRHQGQPLPTIYIHQTQDPTRNLEQSSQTTDRIRNFLTIQKEADLRKIAKYQVNINNLPPLGLNFDN